MINRITTPSESSSESSSGGGSTSRRATDTGTTPRPKRGVVSHVFELGELQLRLLSADARTAGESSKWGALIAIIASVLMLGAMPIVLAATAALLVQQFEWSWASSLGLVGGGAMLIGLASLYWGLTIIKNGVQAFERSRSELQENLAWAKSIFSGQ